jgi:multidrug efflux pump subunit AcrA (membrane-fusion protein)
MASKPVPLFRREAIDAQRVRVSQGEALTLDPSANAWGFVMLCVGIGFTVFFAWAGHINEYASGPAFVQLEGGTSLTATLPGLVNHVAVKPGDRVHAGDELLRFHSADELSELQAATREFDDQLAKLLLRPDDAASREALVTLRARRDVAEQRLSQRTLRAAADGVVADVRVREGQVVEQGVRLIDLQSVASNASITALLPGRYRPMLHAGDKLRFHVDGFQHVTQEIEIDNVGEQIVGPNEARRFVGRDLSDAFAINGPVVLVSAKLPNSYFEMDGQRYDYASGMFGKAEVSVRSERIVYAFVPSLKSWSESISHVSASALQPTPRPTPDVSPNDIPAPDDDIPSALPNQLPSALPKLVPPAPVVMQPLVVPALPSHPKKPPMREQVRHGR